MTPKNQIWIHGEIKSRLNLGDTYFQSVQNHLSCNFLSKNIKVKICRTVVLPVLCDCDTQFLMLREKHRLRVFENRVLREMFGLKREEIIGGW
jgi:hypothetical protein